MKLFADIKEFVMALQFIDLVFFFAVLTLMILIVTLIYFIKINDEVLKENEDVKEETQEMKIVKEITDNLNNNYETPNISFTDYEKDQEDKAIISYEELLNKNTNYEINYEKEEFHDDLRVKKFDLENLINPTNEKSANAHEVRVISFAKEEAFLQALKRLQNELN